ncbi:MAG: PQQ-binding-like beta-propeller repeat protein [Phycisphaeraceae bacterium]
MNKTTSARRSAQGFIACVAAMTVSLAALFAFAQEAKDEKEAPKPVKPVQIQAGQIIQLQIAPGGTVPAPAKAAPVKAGEEKKEVIDEELEKDIAKLKGELEKLKKGTTDYDLKLAELTRKERMLAAKVALKRREQALEEQQNALLTGAALDSDPEIDHLLDRAREYANEGRFHDACVLWQHVLNLKTGLTDRLPASKDAEPSPGPGAQVLYRPVRDLIEAEVAALPAEGLSEYRIVADSEARAILAQINPDNEKDQLAKVIRQYFISSLGDDAAYRLACIYMDEWDFVAARRLLDKTTRVHPDASMSRADLLVRLSLACAKAGDSLAARAALDELQKLATNEAVSASLVAAVRDVVENGAPLLAASEVVEGWPMSLGSAGRDGIMAGLPGKPVEKNRLWTEQPLYQFESYRVPELVSRGQMMGTPQTQPQSRNEIISRWEKGGWTPNAQVVLRGGTAFVKTHNELRWYDLATRKLVDKIEQEKIKLEAGAKVWPQNLYYYGNQQKPNAPSTQEEIAMFGDRTGKAMTLVDDTLYHIEGKLYTGMGQRMMMWNNGKQSSLTMIETLAAVDVSDAGKGKRIKWRFPKEDEAGADVRFLGAPTPVGDRLLVPVISNQELMLVGLKKDTGEVVFKTTLCNPEMSELNRWASVGISIVGSEAYVASGFGVVFSVDAGTGDVLWAVRYKRSEPVDQGNSSNQIVFGGRRMMQNLSGFDEDVIIPRGDKLILTASDSDEIQCLNRATGKLVWRSPRNKATYVLGVINDSLYIAGREAVRRYGISSGKLERESQVKDSLGRGALTPQGVYLPVKHEIIRFDADSLEPVGKLRVASSHQDPVGNLFADGKHLVAAGLDRIYSLVDGEAKLVELTALIAKKDNGTARLERAFLYEVEGKHDAALEDLRAAFKLLSAGDSRKEAAQKLMAALLERTAKNPPDALALYEEAEVVAITLNQQVRIWLARGRYHVQQKQLDQGLDLLLRAAQDTGDALALVDETDGRRDARVALAASAAIQDLARTQGAEFVAALDARGRTLLQPHLDLAKLEKLLSEPGKALPQAAEVSKLAGALSEVAQERDKLAAKLAPAFKQRDELRAAIDAEKKNPAGKLEELEKQLAAWLADHQGELVKLDELAAKLEPKQRELDAARKRMADALSSVNDLKNNRGGEADKLLAIAGMFPGSSVERDAMLQAARHLWNAGQFERSEKVLQDLAESGTSANAAAGVEALARAYENRKWQRQAYFAWQRLQRDHGEAMLPAEAGPVRAADVAAKALASIKIDDPAAGIIDRRLPVAPLEQAWADSSSGGRYIIDTDDSSNSEFLENHLVTINTSNATMIARNVNDGDQVWSLSMKQGNVSGTSTSNGRLVQYNNYSFPNGKLQRSGHIGLLFSPDRIMAFGLVTGEKLWEVEALDSTNQRNRGAYYPYANPMGPVAIGGDVVAEFGVGKDRGQQQVRAVDLHTGRTRWISEFQNDSIVGVGAFGRIVYVFVNNGSEVICCDSLTGERLGRVKFENRQPQHPIAYTKHGLMSINQEGVTMYDVPTGRKLWFTQTRGLGQQQIFTSYFRVDMLSDERCLVLNQGLFVFELKTGKILAQSVGAELGRYVYDAAATPDGREVIAIGYGAANEQLISVIDTSNGKVKASLNLGPRVGAQVQAFKVAAGGELMPALVPDLPQVMANGAKRYSNIATLGFYRKSDGQRIEMAMPGGKDALRLTNAQSPMVRGNMLLLVNHLGVTAFRMKPGAQPEPLKPFVEPKPEKGNKTTNEKLEEKKKDEKGAAAVPAVPGIQAVPIAPVQRAVIIRNGARIEVQGAGNIEIRVEVDEAEEKKAEDNKEGSKQEGKQESKQESKEDAKK